MADEGSEKEHKPGDDGAKGRTVFGIGLPASIQPAKGAPMPFKPPPAAAPAFSAPFAASARPAPQPVPAAPPPRDDADDSATLEDVRALTRPSEGRSEERRTIVGLPSQIIGGPGASGRLPVEPQPLSAEVSRSDATVPDLRHSGEWRRVSGEFPVAAHDSATRATRVKIEEPPPPEPARELRAQVRLTANKPIPGTRYRLVRWLGEGGMGVVYEAEHIDIERRVALKILRAELSQRSDTAQVFRDEAKAAARAGSKHIVEIFDFGELPDGRLFFCMELLSGIDLASQVQPDLEFARAIAILRQCCKGLGAAHKAGVVHRDIKPENIILVRYEGRRDMVKIVDFGVSAIVDARRGGGPIAGTPQYMAPEQINGGEFDARLDMYALGCVAYEMLVGHPPFTDENLAEVLLAHMNRPPPRPSEVRADRKIPRALEDVVMRCLEKHPNARFADMADLEAALCEAQIAAGIITEWDDLPLPDVDPERRAALVTRMPSVHEAPRRRWLLPVAAAVFAAMLTGGVLLAVGGPEPTPEEVARIEALSRVAREAASYGNYVARVDDSKPTALATVEELEGVAGAGEALADQRGKELRGEFSNQLVSFGDGFYQQKATRPLAGEYYRNALAFDETNQRALERTRMSRTEIVALRDDIRNGTLSEAAMMSMMGAGALTVKDEDKRSAGLQKILAVKTEAPLSARAELVAAARGAGVELQPRAPVAEPVPKEPVDRPVEPGPEVQVQPPPEPPPPEPPVADVPEPPVAEPDKKPAGKPGTKKKGDEEFAEGVVKRDPEKAAELASQGKAALEAGNRAKALELFNDAVSHDQKNIDALSGLSDIYFDRGSADGAIRYAERAVNARGGDWTLRIKLGDAYYIALRYRDALAQYEKALELNSPNPKASARIAKVKAKLGQ